MKTTYSLKDSEAPCEGLVVYYVSNDSREALMIKHVNKFFQVIHVDMTVEGIECFRTKKWAEVKERYHYRVFYITNDFNAFAVLYMNCTKLMCEEKVSDTGLLKVKTSDGREDLYLVRGRFYADFFRYRKSEDRNVLSDKEVDRLYEAHMDRYSDKEILRNAVVEFMWLDSIPFHR